MSYQPSDVQRCTVLQAAAGLAAAGQAVLGNANAAALPPSPTGKPGDFDFLSGEWKIKNKRMNNGTWEMFDGEATVHGLLAGVASVEELRIPASSVAWACVCSTRNVSCGPTSG